MTHTHSLCTIPDDELLHRLVELLRDSRRTEADLVAHIGEVDRRRLYARQASPSMFSYCTHVLHLSEPEAYLRITAARAVRSHPVLLPMLADGRLHLSGIAKLAPHLTPETRDALLSRATHRSKRQILELIAEICPRPDVPSLVRKLPGARREMPPAVLPAPGEHYVAAGIAAVVFGHEVPADRIGPGQADVGASGDGGVGAAPLVSPAEAANLEKRPGEATGGMELGPGRVGSPRHVVEPLAPSRYKVQFTANAELKDKLERLQALLCSEVPDGDLGAIIDRAVSEKLDRLEARRFAKRGSSRQTKTVAQSKPRLSRHIPAAIRRAVHQRDGGRCRYVDEARRRCPARHRLEYHHLHPFGVGGGHTLENVRLMCRTHNLCLAEHDYGPEAMAAYRTDRERPGAPDPPAWRAPGPSAARPALS